MQKNSTCTTTTVCSFHCANIDKILWDMRRKCTRVVLSNIPRKQNELFINIHTFDGIECCIRMSAGGFQLAGSKFDINDIRDSAIYETWPELYKAISKKNVNEFAQELTAKLVALKNLYENLDYEQKK